MPMMSAEFVALMQAGRPHSDPRDPRPLGSSGRGLFTSRTCLSCGHVSVENRKTQAYFACVRCGYRANADVVGARNAKRAGLVLRDARAA
ncbi:zinc ribbon domain-containing protein [Nonomuraea africana]